MLRCLVPALFQHSGKDGEGFDPITLKRYGEVGVEPAKCYYIQRRDAILGKDRIDLELDPPPDLAIEADTTSTTRPEDYQPLGIPELWIYREDSLHICVLSGGTYRESPRSPTFPGIPVCHGLARYIQRAWEAGSSAALREFEAELRSMETGG
jgi:Uma2 family endonuclease